MKLSAVGFQLALGALLALTCTQVGAEKRVPYSLDEFNEILVKAGKKAGNDKIEPKKGPVPIVASVVSAGGNSFEVGLTGTWYITSNQVRTLTILTEGPDCGGQMGDRSSDWSPSLRP